MGKTNFSGPIKPGEVRNPKGNPNPNIKYAPKTGSKTKEGKLKQAIAKMVHGKQSKLLKSINNCDECPLRPRIEERVVNDRVVRVGRPGCGYYRSGGECKFDYKDFVQKIKSHYEIGEKLGTVELHKYMAMELLTDAEMARTKEIMEKKHPGFYTLKFMELAGQNLGQVNKQIYGEKSENIQHNIDWTDAVVAAYEQRKNNGNKIGQESQESNDKGNEGS
ncbi:MAG: hypothetical protein ACOCUI_03835 [bacterium]